MLQRKTIPTQLLLCFYRLWSWVERTGWCLLAVQTLSSLYKPHTLLGEQQWMNSDPSRLKNIKLEPHKVLHQEISHGNGGDGTKRPAMVGTIAFFSKNGHGYYLRNAINYRLKNHNEPLSPQMVPATLLAHGLNGTLYQNGN
jgi:hypothetical protein